MNKILLILIGIVIGVGLGVGGYVFINRAAKPGATVSISAPTASTSVSSPSVPTASTTGTPLATDVVQSSPQAKPAAVCDSGLNYYKAPSQCIEPTHVVGLLLVPKDYVNSIDPKWRENMTLVFGENQTFFDREFSKKLPLSFTVIPDYYVASQTLEQMRGRFDQTDTHGNSLGASYDEQQANMRTAIAKELRDQIVASSAYKKAVADSADNNVLTIVYFNEASGMLSNGFALRDSYLKDETIRSKYSDGRPSLQYGILSVATNLAQRWAMPTAKQLGYSPESDANNYLMGPYESYKIFQDLFVLPEVKKDMGFR